MTYSWATAAGVAFACATCALGVPPSDGNLYVTEEGPGNVFEHHGVTGALVGTFSTVTPPRALMGIHTGGALGNVLVGSGQGGVRELDRTTGAVVKTYNAGGGWQWAGVWKGNGNVLIGDMSTNDIREYDSTTGAFLSVFANVPGAADMRFGPNGNLFVCSFTGGGVYELDGVTGAMISHWTPSLGLANDIAFLPDGRRIVTSMFDNKAHVFDAGWNFITSFAGTGWGRVHGIDISPHDGNIYIIDGVTTAVHVFDSTTYSELNANFLSTGTKPVDLEFRQPIPAPGALCLIGAGALIAGRRRRR